MSLRNETLSGERRSADPASRTLASAVREHLLGTERDPLPATVQARLSGSSGGARLGTVAAVVVGFGEAVRALVRGELIEPEAEERLLRVVVGCGIRASAFDADGALSRLARAAGKRELLRGELPAWHVGARGLAESSPRAVWSVAEVGVHQAEPLEAAPQWAAWAHSDRALEEGLSRQVDLSGFGLVGRGRLVVEAGGLRLDSPECWLHVALRSLRSLELCADGVVLHAADRRLALIDGDGWFLAEALRLAHAAPQEGPA